jgi:hypothetical protein
VTQQTALERAFDLAQSGTCAGIQHIRQQLRAEGYSDAQIWGPSLTRQLRELCEAATRTP